MTGLWRAQLPEDQEIGDKDKRRWPGRELPLACSRWVLAAMGVVKQEEERGNK